MADMRILIAFFYSSSEAAAALLLFDFYIWVETRVVKLVVFCLDPGLYIMEDYKDLFWLI